MSLVAPTSAMPAERCTASVYWEGFGRPLANGRQYRPDEVLAAHRTLPFGTLVRVTVMSIKGPDGRRPDREAEKPGVDGRRPDREAEKPGVDGRRPDREAEKPGVDGGRPDREAEKPGVDGRRPDREKEKPAAAAQRLDHDQRSLIVPVFDRGPFVRGRCIDLSRGAAARLGVFGLARVSIEVLRLGPGNGDQP